jgi:hypothetical protein
MAFLKRLAEGRRLFRTYLWGKPRLPLAGERGGGRYPPEVSPKKRPARETRSERKAIDTRPQHTLGQHVALPQKMGGEIEGNGRDIRDDDESEEKKDQKRRNRLAHLDQAFVGDAHGDEEV